MFRQARIEEVPRILVTKQSEVDLPFYQRGDFQII